MKLLQPILATLILATTHPAYAEAPTTPAMLSRPPQATLAAVMEEAGQALLFDRIKGKYVVVRVGEVFQGFRVTTIERDQLLLTTLSAPPRHYVLPRTSELRRVDVKKPKRSDPQAPTTTPVGRSISPPRVTHLRPDQLRLIDPYAEDHPSVIDPYPDSNDIKKIVAPTSSRAPQPAKADDETVTRNTPSSDKTSAPTTGPAKVVTLSRAEFDAALDDFHTLAKEIQLAVTPNGVEIAELGQGTFFQRLGFRKSDRILSVAGQPITNLDAAASVYARLMRAKQFSVIVKRDKRELTLRFRFTK